MKTNHLFSALLSLALICPGIAQETHYQRPPAVIEEVALAKLSPIIRISDNTPVRAFPVPVYRQACATGA